MTTLTMASIPTTTDVLTIDQLNSNFDCEVATDKKPHSRPYFESDRWYLSRYPQTHQVLEALYKQSHRATQSMVSLDVILLVDGATIVLHGRHGRQSRQYSAFI